MSGLGPVLLVEDNALDVELTMEAFRESRIANQVVVLRDGVEALDYLFRRGAYAGLEGPYPVFTLLDVKMPKVDGIEVLRALKGDAALKRLPVVMLTSSKEERDLVRSYDLGVNAYVVKPIHFGDMVEAIRKLGGFWPILNEPPPMAGRQ